MAEVSGATDHSQICTYDGHGGNQEDAQPALCSYHSIPASPVELDCNHLLSTPEILSIKRMQIGGNPSERDQTLKSKKKGLDFVLDKLTSREKVPAATVPGEAEVSDYSPTQATYVDFLSSEDYTCVSETPSGPLVVVIGLPQHSEEKDVVTGVEIEPSSVEDQSIGRDKETQGTLYVYVYSVCLVLQLCCQAL